MKNTFQRTQRELHSALGALRLLVKEVGGNYLAGLQSEAARIQQELRESNKPSRKKIDQMSAMLKMIRDLKVKPPKGRRRDLKALDKTISKLSDLVDNW